MKISFKIDVPVSMQSFCANISGSILLSGWNFDLDSLVDGCSWFTTEETSDRSSITMGVDSWIPALLLGKVWSFCKCDVDFGSVCHNNVGALLLVANIWHVNYIGTFCCEVADGGNTPNCVGLKSGSKMIEQLYDCSKVVLNILF